MELDDIPGTRPRRPTGRVTLAQVEEYNREYFASLPNAAFLRLADVVTLPWTPERNLVLRRALGVPMKTGETVQLDQAGVIRITTELGRERVDRIAGQLRDQLPSPWEVDVRRGSVTVITARLPPRMIVDQAPGTLLG